MHMSTRVPGMCMWSSIQRRGGYSQAYFAFRPGNIGELQVEERKASML